MLVPGPILLGHRFPLNVACAMLARGLLFKRQHLHLNVFPVIQEPGLHLQAEVAH